MIRMISYSKFTYNTYKMSHSSLHRWRWAAVENREVNSLERWEKVGKFAPHAISNIFNNLKYSYASQQSSAASSVTLPALISAYYRSIGSLSCTRHIYWHWSLYFWCPPRDRPRYRCLCGWRHLLAASSRRMQCCMCSTLDWGTRCKMESEAQVDRNQGS